MSDNLVESVNKILVQKNDVFSDIDFQKKTDQAAQDFEKGLSSEDDPKNRSQVFKNIIQSPHRLNILSGPPGSAKTYLAAAVMQFFDQTLNKNVWGLSLSEQAVMRLAEKSGISGLMIEDFFKSPETIPPESIVVIDEVGLIGTQMMIDILEKAQEGQWGKLLFLGDYRQKTPDDGGQPLLLLEKEFPELWFELKTGFRQKTPIQRDFVTNLYQADATKALNVLEDTQNLLWMNGAEDTLDEAVMAYLKWRSFEDNYEKTALVLTQTAQEADEANKLVQLRIRTFSERMIWNLLNDTHAMTIQEAQGLAMDQSFVALTDKVTGQTMVSACSRHRYGIQLIVDKSVYKNLDDLSKDANQFKLD